MGLLVMIRSTLGLQTAAEQFSALGGMQPLVARSGQWPRVRAEHLLKEPCCQVCGTRRDLEVHHVVPLHVAPAMELHPMNLLTLCGHCHLLFGHLMRWTDWNPGVRDEARRMREHIAGRRRLSGS